MPAKKAAAPKKKSAKREPLPQDGKIRVPYSPPLVDKGRPAHEVDKGDPKTNGPYLDDRNREQLAAYEERRRKEANARNKTGK